MALLDIRLRSGYLFLAVMLGLVLLISAQVNSRSGVPVIEEVTFGVFSEVQRGLSSAVSGIRHTWSAYADLRQVKSAPRHIRVLVDRMLARLAQAGPTEVNEGLQQRQFG